VTDKSSGRFCTIYCTDPARFKEDVGLDSTNIIWRNCHCDRRDLFNSSTTYLWNDERNFVMKKIRKGFTLIEMVIVLFIISLLLLIMIPNLTEQKNNANKRSDEALQTTVINQAELYSETHDGDFSLDDLEDTGYITGNQKKKLKGQYLKKDDTGKWILEKDS